MIPLNETQFDFDDINEHIIGAGILPVSVDDDGAIRLLLGKERYINHWRGSLKWSGFEGGRKSGENIEYTAAREFIEESIGVVEIDGKQPTVESVAQYVQNGKYVARIVLCILHGEDSERRYHVTYLVEVPYDTSYVTHFMGRRRAFVDMHTKTHQLNRLTEQVNELCFPVQGNVFDGHRVAAIVRVEKGEGILRVEFVDEEGEKQVHEFEDIDDDDVALYLRWFNLRVSCTTDYDNMDDLCKRALSITRDSRNIITHAKVNEDFIEKQHVQWWSLKELRTVLRNGGYMNTEFFRAYFLPVLQRAIQEIDRIQIESKAASEESNIKKYELKGEED